MVSYDLLLFMLKVETTARGTNSMPFHVGTICSPHRGSFAVQFGDHFRSGDHLRSGIICCAVPFIYSTLIRNVLKPDLLSGYCGIWSFFVLPFTLQYSKKRQGIRGGSRALSSRCVSGLKGREEGSTFGNKRRASRLVSFTEQGDAAAMLYLRVNATKNQRNRGHSSKFNFAHTLSIGRPKSHTYDKDVRLLKFSLVWEKST